MLCYLLFCLIIRCNEEYGYHINAHLMEMHRIFILFWNFLVVAIKKTVLTILRNVFILK